jgi:hypothetical protein
MSRLFSRRLLWFQVGCVFFNCDPTDSKANFLTANVARKVEYVECAKLTLKSVKTKHVKILILKLNISYMV